MRRTRYKTIVDHFAQRIRSGQLCPGTQLPTVRALMASEQVALATALRVYHELEAIGLVVGEPGRGTFVRDTSLPRGMGLEQHPASAASVDLAFNYPSLPGQAESLREGLRAIAASGDLDALLHSAPQGGRPHERQTAARHLRNREIRVAARLSFPQVKQWANRANPLACPLGRSSTAFTCRPSGVVKSKGSVCMVEAPVCATTLANPPSSAYRRDVLRGVAFERLRLA